MSPTTVGSDPGKTLGLSSADEDYTPTLTPQSATLNVLGGGTVSATYLQGPDGVVTSPGSPALPLAIADVTVPDQVLRGVGFLGGTFSDTTGITPLTGDVADRPERLARAVRLEHASSRSGSGRSTTSGARGRHHLDRADADPGAVRVGRARARSTDDQRAYSDVGVRLFYSANKTGAALAAPPTIARVDATSSGGVVTFTVHVVGDPAAGIQDVWVTYLPPNGDAVAVARPDAGHDRHDALDGHALDGRPIQFMVQAVNGVGPRHLDDERRRLLPAEPDRPGTPDRRLPRPRETLALGAVATSAPYGAQVSLSATLRPPAGAPCAGKTVTFTIGNPVRTGVDQRERRRDRAAPVDRPPRGVTGAASSFGGDAALAGSSTSAPFAITPSRAALSLGGGGVPVLDGSGHRHHRDADLERRPASAADDRVRATPRAARRSSRPDHRPLGDRVARRGAAGARGTYTVQAIFGPGGPTPPTLVADPVYAGSSALVACRSRSPRSR